MKSWNQGTPRIHRHPDQQWISGQSDTASFVNWPGFLEEAAPSADPHFPHGVDQFSPHGGRTEA